MRPEAPFAIRLLLLPLLSLPLAAQAGGKDDDDDAEPDELRPLAEAVNAFPSQAKFDHPLQVEFTSADPDFAYVVTQPGLIFRVPRRADASARTVFADLKSKVYYGDFWEEGLLGFAFDPDYLANGWVYVDHTEKTPMQEGMVSPTKKGKSTRRSVIARYATRIEDGVRVLDPTTELRILVQFQPYANHNGGTIVFGPDKMLYIAFGDGGAQRDPSDNGQDKTTLLGKVLRIDVRGATAERPYAIPADNPFVQPSGHDGGARGEIWCYGLRNPWRIAFDRGTGDLWCGDVGQDDIEEVDRLVKGGNYGWSLMEGTAVFKKTAVPTTGLIPPIAEYKHPIGQSVTGGYVYRGKAIPALVGSYVYCDFVTSHLWCVREDREHGKHAVREIGRTPITPSSFAEEPDGELLLTCFDGRIYRLMPFKE
jgi:glucose/arabinose dehydrogenase